MKKSLYAILILLMSAQVAFPQQKVDEIQKLTSLCKIWGFLKYYHPNVSKGSFDWDEELIRKIREVNTINTKAELNKTYLNWLDQLGEFPKCEGCGLKKDVDYFDKNFDLDWTDDREVFSAEVIEKLNFIEENRNQAVNHYIDYENKGKNVKVKNEQDYNIQFPEYEYRLLELFRYWNLVQYFFPYKYQTDQK